MQRYAWCYGKYISASLLDAISLGFFLWVLDAPYICGIQLYFFPFFREFVVRLALFRRE